MIRAMGRYLKHIYSLSLSSTVCPIESYITSVVGKVPMPYYGGRPFHVILDAALIAATSKPMKPIIFQGLRDTQMDTCFRFIKKIEVHF